MEVITTDQRTGKELILGKGIPFWIVTIILGLLAITLLIWVATTSLVRVSYSFSDPNQKGDVQLVAVGPDSNESKVGFVFGDLAAIPRNTQLFIARSGSMETRLTVDDLPLFGIPNLNLELQPQHTVSKLGSDTQGCNLVNPNGTFTYNCLALGGMAQIHRPVDGIWSTDTIPSPNTGIFARYQQGFLTFDYADPQLSYFIPGGATKRVSLPKTFVQRSQDKVAVLTNQTNSQDSSFVVTDFSTGNSIYSANLDDAKNARLFTRKANSNSNFDSGFCAMNSDNLVCYYGPTTHDEPSDGHDYRASHPNGSIEVTPLKNPDQAKVYTMLDLRTVDQTYLSASGTIYLLSGNSLYTAKPQGDSLQVRLSYTSVSSVGITSKNVFISADNKVIEIDEANHTSHLRFQSNNIATPMLSIYGDTVLINAFINTSADDSRSAFAHVYQLNTTPMAANQIRKEDFLPYAETPTMSFMDYSDKQIYIALMPVFTTHDDGSTSIDQNATLNQASPIKDRLQKDGLLTNGTQLLIKY